jgi:hypothetical protein
LLFFPEFFPEFWQKHGKLQIKLWKTPIGRRISSVALFLCLLLHCPDNERINKVTKEKDFYYGTKENKEDVLDAREAATAVPLDVRTGSVPTGGTQHG